jgi:hypothetical protein
VSRARPAPGGDGRVGRWIRAVRGGETVIDTHRAKMPHAVLARYFSSRARTLAGTGPATWSRSPRPRARPASMTFFNEAVDLRIDGELQERPETPWGRPGWWRDYTEVR